MYLKFGNRVYTEILFSRRVAVLDDKKWKIGNEQLFSIKDNVTYFCKKNIRRTTLG